MRRGARERNNLNKRKKKVQNKKIVAPDEEPAGPTETELLEEILGELRKK